MLGEQVDVLALNVGRHTVHGVAQIGEPAAFRLLYPRLIVAVAVENDALVRGEGVVQQGLQGGLEVFRPLQNIGELPQLLCHDCVQHHIGAGDGLGGAEHTELKLVAREGEGRGTVAVCGVLRYLGQGIHADSEPLFGDVHILRALHDGVENGGQLIAQKDGDDGGRSLVATQAVVVAGVGYAAAQHLLILVHALDKRRQEQQELRVLAGCAAGLQEILARIGGQRPVVVLAAAVDAREGLFMQQAHQPVTGGDLLQHFHGELVFVAGGVRVGVDGSQLMLGGCDLVVLGLGQHTQLPQLLVQLAHERGHTRLDGSVIVVVQFLPLCRTRTEQRAPAELQILALVVHFLVDEEILLLGTDLRKDMLCLSVAEKTQDTEALLIQHMHGTQQRRFLVERLAAVGAENGGDIERFVLYEGVGGGIPRGVATRLEGGAQTAGGERGGIGLALAQLLGTQLHHHAILAVAGDKAVVLFGGEAGHGLEPVGVVRCTLFDRPVLHGVSDLTGGGTIQRCSLCKTLLPLLIDGGGETLLHLLLSEYHLAEQGGNVCNFFTHAGSFLSS